MSLMIDGSYECFLSFTDRDINSGASLDSLNESFDALNESNHAPTASYDYVKASYDSPWGTIDALNEWFEPLKESKDSPIESYDSLKESLYVSKSVTTPSMHDTILPKNCTTLLKSAYIPNKIGLNSPVLTSKTIIVTR